MLLHEVTGRQLRGARQALGLSLAGLAARAGINRDDSRHSRRPVARRPAHWEISSESIVPAQYQMLCRAVSALEAEGIRFSDGGVPPVCQSGVPDN
jgi:transcriptional regulator with XRE-family HTH domain